MGLVNDLEKAINEMRIDTPTLQGQQTLYLNVMATALAFIADKMVEEDKPEKHLNYEQFCKLKEEVIGEATVFCVEDIAPIFDKYEALIFGEETDD